MDRHQPAIEQFIRRYGGLLDNERAALLSVSLSAAGDEEDQYAAWAYTRDLIAESAWRPTHVEIVAGALRFSASDFFRRWAMKRLSHRKRVPLEQTGDYEFTDWQKLDRFLRQFLEHGGVQERQEGPGPHAA
jgi:menaquinone-dependent protoporphyrinogen oxidase